ncbi:MAG: TfoX/Sxy family protein [Vampirovibrio sp.]|nr:TfoX/Sxy family protein [Vampirovibrio sp.]
MTTSSFVEFILDQLDGLPDVVSKRMFGGHGLYAGGVFIGIFADGLLYLKTDTTTRQPYIEAGMGPFQFQEKTLKNYYQVPVDVLEDTDTLKSWAQQSIKVAQAG